MSIIIGVLIIGLLLLISIKAFNNHRMNDIKADEEYLHYLDTEISKAENELNELKQVIINNHMNKDMRLTPMMMEVLDIYDDHAIKLPIDILEEVSRLYADDKTTLLEMVEVRRQNWKAECQKKLIKQKMMNL